MICVQDIIKKVDECKDEALQYLIEAIQSPSPTGSELPMAKTVHKWLDKIGIQVDTYEYMKDRPNFIATWKGTQEGKTFLFNGHMDVFPATETDDPNYNAWSGEIKDGCVYGRGTSDMKGGDCAALMAVKLLKEMGFDPKGNVVLNFVSDEESGGEYGILSLLKDDLIHADFGISMEPSSHDEQSTDLMVGHGGVYPCQVIVYGDGGHAARPLDPEDKDNHYGGEDAIKKAMKAVEALNHLLCRVDTLAFDYEQVSFTRFYFLRSFAKKPSASLRMSFAVRSSAFSRSSSRMRMDCSSALSVFAGGVFRRMLRQSASV